MSTIIPHFYTANLHRTIAYYTHVLCFDLVLDQGELSDDSCMLQFGDSNLIFEELPCDDLNATTNFFNGKLNIFVDEISSVFDKICDFADVQSEVCQTGNGTREFSVKDCNGIELVFAEVLSVDCNSADSSYRYSSKLNG